MWAILIVFFIFVAPKLSPAIHDGQEVKTMSESMFSIRSCAILLEITGCLTPKHPANPQQL
jgi:hypothetical protein